jgi:hypothetical protein
MAQDLPAQPMADIAFLNGNIYTGVVDATSFHGTRVFNSYIRQS